MKWLKIKKCLKIFSVIICSIFIFSNKASASNANLEYNFYTKEYNKNIINYFNEYDIDIVSQLNDLISYYESNLDEEFLVFFNLDGYYFNISIYIFDDINKFKNFNFYNYSKSKNLDLSFSYDKYNEPNNILFSNYINGQDNWSFDNINYIFDNLKNKLDNWIINKNWNTSNLFYDSFRYGGFNFSDYNTFNDNSNLLIYSSFDIKYNINSSGNNDFIKVKINDSFILDNESSLKEFINSYSFLNKKENPLKYRMQFNNDVSPDLKQITFDFSSYEFTEGSNPVKTKIEMGSNSLLAEEIPNYLNSYIYGYGTDGVKYDMSEYIDFTIDTTNYLTTKELTFTYTLKKELPKDILRIFIYYDFETINNNYFFNVFDNATWGSVFWEYIENFLVGYKKYTFPEGYDLAIIRSKSFKDLESFYISDKVYFTNPDYDFNLKLYDFKNKIEKYNFNSLTQYLINDVYLKIPIKIDETNNIFPVLTKPMNNESGVFYLKDNLFVQFVNSENLDSIIDGIPEDDFNDNNDLNIDSDIGNLNPPQQDEQSLTVFFNEFWKMFEKFSDILSYITSCFTQFFISLPTTIQFFLCVSFAFVIYKMIVFFIL